MTEEKQTQQNDEPKKGKNLKLGGEFFEHGGVSNLTRQAHAFYDFILERVDVLPQGGFRRYYAGCKFPKKGFPFEEAMVAMDISKKYTMAFAMTLASKDLVIPVLSLFLLRKKTRTRIFERAIKRFVMLSNYTMAGIYLLPRFYGECPSAIWNFVSIFLREIGIERVLADNVGKIFATIIEYDDAYRYRLEDIVSEFTREEILKNPRKALDKLIRIVQERDKQVGEKFVAFAKILKFALLLPSVKRSFKWALRLTEFKDLQYDVNDKYHCYLRTGYNYFGMTDQQRIDKWIEMHEGNVPPQIQLYC